jgi:hypothetical protein
VCAFPSPATFRPGPWNASGWAGPVNPTVPYRVDALHVIGTRL